MDEIEIEETPRAKERRSELRLALKAAFQEHREYFVQMLIEANVKAAELTRAADAKMITEANLKALDDWASQRSQLYWSRFGKSVFGAVILAGLAALGWKGWVAK